jgi:hypothetical protein
MKVAPSHCHWGLARTIWYLRRSKMQITFLPHLHMGAVAGTPTEQAWW